MAGVLSVIALLPFLWPYYQVDQAHGLARDVNVVTQYNAGWRDYLVTGGRLHFAWWSHVFYEGRTALFPGVTAIVLAAIALVSGRAIRDPRARMALAIGVLGVALSFGTSLPGYPFLHQALPLRQRPPQRGEMGMAGAGGGRDPRGVWRRRAGSRLRQGERRAGARWPWRCRSRWACW